MWLCCCWCAVFLTLAAPGNGLDKDDPKVDGLIRKYWFQYTKIAVILVYLRTVHRVRCGMTWLKKRIKDLGLARRGCSMQYSLIPQVQHAIEKELQGCNSNVGYRQMWRILQTTHNLTVKRSTVQMLLAVLDPEGVKRRKGRRLKRRVYQNKGPDFVWHIDGYDKLKPYGFTIHGCMDGYSRSIIWLELSSTNNDPGVILLHYLRAVLENKGCPTILRSDKGTENCTLAATQMALRHSHSDNLSGEKSFRYGPSTTNTRIEGFWSQLRSSLTDWWINLFKDLVQQGKFNPHNVVHRHSLAFVYGGLLRKALQEFQKRWNSHRIRPNRTAGCPPGVPNDLYCLPALTGTVSYKKTTDFDVWAHCYVEHAHKPLPFYPLEFKDAARAILDCDLNLTERDITLEVAEPIYNHLVYKFSQ